MAPPAPPPLPPHRYPHTCSRAGRISLPSLASCRGHWSCTWLPALRSALAETRGQPPNIRLASSAANSSPRRTTLLTVFLSGGPALPSPRFVHPPLFIFRGTRGHACWGSAGKHEPRCEAHGGEPLKMVPSLSLWMNARFKRFKHLSQCPQPLCNV